METVTKSSLFGSLLRGLGLQLNRMDMVLLHLLAYQFIYHSVPHR